jgi:hypothetical protein
MNPTRQQDDGSRPVYFISATTADFQQFRQDLRDRLGGRSQENLELGPATNLSKLADEIRHDTAVIHLVGPSIGGGLTKASEVEAFFDQWGPGIEARRDATGVELLRILRGDERFKTWPRTYWEAYLAILLGKGLSWICQRPAGTTGPWEHPRPEGREHLQIASRIGWDRTVIDTEHFTVDRIVALVKEKVLIFRPRSFSALTTAPAVSADYVSRPKNERRICAWLDAFANSSANRTPSKLLSCSGDGAIGKTQMVAYCIRKRGLSVGVDDARKIAVFYLKGGTDDGLTFINLILGVSHRLLPAGQHEELNNMWGLADKTALIRRWFSFVNQTGFQLLIWTDQSEHNFDLAGNVADIDILKWLQAWDEIQNAVFLVNTTRRSVRVTRNTNRTEVDLSEGLPADRRTIAIFRRHGISPERVPDEQLLALVRAERGVPGRLEGWIRFLNKHPEGFGVVPENSCPDDLALRLLSEKERRVLMAINILNQTAVSSAEVAAIMNLEAADAEQLVADLRLWLIASESAPLYSMHDTIKESLDRLFVKLPAQRAELTHLCADWLVDMKAKPTTAWRGPEDLDPYIHAVGLFIRGGMFTDAAHLLNTFDQQIPPHASMLFRFGRTKDCRSLRSELVSRLSPGSKIEWINSFQLALAEIRLGENLAAAQKALESARDTAHAQRWDVESALTYYYLALVAYQGTDFALDEHALSAANGMLALARNAISVAQEQDSVATGVRGNICGLSGVIAYRQAITAQDTTEAQRLAEEAASRFAKALELTGPEGSADHRANGWWNLHHAKACCIAEMLRTGVAGTDGRKQITEIVDDGQAAREPETVLEATLFQSDLCRILGHDDQAIDYARKGLISANRTGNTRQVACFGARLLLLVPDDMHRDSVTQLFQNKGYALDAMLLPLRGRPEKKMPFDLPAAQVDALRKQLSQPSGSNVSVA